MAKTFSVFKHKSRPQFDTVAESEKNKKKRARRTVNKKNGTRARRSVGKTRPHTTRYEDTVNIYTSDEARSAETAEKLKIRVLADYRQGKVLHITEHFAGMVCFIYGYTDLVRR